MIFAFSEQISSQCGHIRQISLGEVAVKSPRRLDFSVYLTVPNSGDSLITIACPLDPSDEDWSQASDIVCKIIGKRLGGMRLRGRSLVCAAANPTVAAAEVAVESIQSAGVVAPAVADV